VQNVWHPLKREKADPLNSSRNRRTNTNTRSSLAFVTQLCQLLEASHHRIESRAHGELLALSARGVAKTLPTPTLSRRQNVVARDIPTVRGWMYMNPLGGNVPKPPVRIPRLSVALVRKRLTVYERYFAPACRSSLVYPGRSCRAEASRPEPSKGPTRSPT
jgi:hypothetical protein